ncbi:MAG: hypothetical protein CSA20_07065 [Deltaproteobacteria bacterium]|nr:MAG: hypothetical protein CSA20_07065 [Deltaproteobacteria bacterium]
MADKLPGGKKARKNVRVAKTATLKVKRLTYPLTSDPGEEGIVINVSEEGVCFHAETGYSEKDQLCLSIDLPGWQQHRKGVSLLVDESLVSAPLTAIVEVVWAKKLPDGDGIEIGARFVDIFEDDLKALKTYLENVRCFAKKDNTCSQGM